MSDFIEALAEELNIRAEVTREVAEDLEPLTAEVFPVLGEQESLRIISTHISVETHRRLSKAQLERKRAGLR